MGKNKKPTIAFLTGPWSNIDDNIREGKSPGGVPSVARAWTTCLEHGFEAHVFILTELEPGWPKETKELGGVHFHWIRKPFARFTSWLSNNKMIGFCKPLWLIWQLQMWYRICRSDIRPDIIYSMRSTFVLVGYFWSLFARAKFVQRQYGTWLYHLWFEQKKWLPRIASLGTLLAFRVPTDLYIMTNDGTYGDRVAKWIKFPMKRFRFWINGVNKSMRIENFDSRAFKAGLGIPAESMVIMTLGRLSYWKRLDRVVSAMPIILKEFPNTHLVIVGDGEMREQLKAQIRKLIISDNVSFVGAVVHDKIKEYLNAADIFLMTNDLTNMCNTLIEALVCSCCVITRDVGSTTEIVTHNENAIVLKPGEADDIAKAVIELFRDRQKCQRLSQAAYEGAMQRFQTWDERMEMEARELKQLVGITLDK